MIQRSSSWRPGQPTTGPQPQPASGLTARLAGSFLAGVGRRRTPAPARDGRELRHCPNPAAAVRPLRPAAGPGR